jgi:hypothetical protein
VAGAAVAGAGAWVAGVPQLASAAPPTVMADIFKKSRRVTFLLSISILLLLLVMR